MIHKLKISVGNIEDAVATMLQSMKLVDRSDDITSVRLPLKSKNGLVEVVVTTSERN